MLARKVGMLFFSVLFAIQTLVGPIGEALAEEELTAQGIMAISKMTGMCGVMDSMVHFQNTTKLAGGDDFVARYWHAEAARLGLTVKQLSDHCDEVMQKYGDLSQLLD